MIQSFLAIRFLIKPRTGHSARDCCRDKKRSSSFSRQLVLGRQTDTTVAAIHGVATSVAAGGSARTQGPLVLIVAPAGYGKTTLLMQWRQALLGANASATVAWLSLEEADSDPNRFLSYLILALNQAGLDLGPLTTLALAQSLDVQAHRTITALLHALARANQRVTLFLDDYHLVANPQLDPLVQALLEQAAPWLEWVVCARRRPNWPLAQWKANGWVHEVSAQALTLSTDETAAILGPDIVPADLDYLHRKTEGWAIAVQLARLWRTHNDATVYGLTAFCGCVTDVADYLTGQVVQRLPAQCQDFLRDMALLDRFNAEIADAVRGRSDSAQLLAQLAHLDALLVPLDAGREWFRHHRLLQDFLHQSLPADAATRIHHAAALWLADKRDWVQAIRYALRARDTRLAVELEIRAGGWEMVLYNGIRYAQSLLSEFDEKTLSTRPFVTPGVLARQAGRTCPRRSTTRPGPQSNSGQSPPAA